MSNDRQRLYALISQYFNSEELRTLYSNLGVDSVFSPRESNASNIRGLIQIMERHGRLGELAEAIHEQRPSLLVGEFERYFQSPSMEAYEVMKPPQPGEPPLAGDACRNIRTALRILGYGKEKGDTYDETLSELVLQFQRDHDHYPKDGNFGPGTRGLLVKVFVEKFGTSHFRHWIDPTDRRNYLAILRERLAKHFSEEELITLCHDLRIDYNDLPDVGLENKARELVYYLERRKHIPDLVEACQKQRPLVSWTRVQ